MSCPWEKSATNLRCYEDASLPHDCSPLSLGLANRAPDLEFCDGRAAGESSRICLSSRWEFSDDDLRHIWFLSLALQAGAGLILFSTEDRMLFVFKFVQMLRYRFSR